MKINIHSATRLRNDTSTERVIFFLLKIFSQKQKTYHQNRWNE